MDAMKTPLDEAPVVNPDEEHKSQKLEQESAPSPADNEGGDWVSIKEEPVEQDLGAEDAWATKDRNHDQPEQVQDAAPQQQQQQHQQGDDAPQPPSSNGFDKVMLSLLSLNESDSALYEIFPDFDGLEPLDSIAWPDIATNGNHHVAAFNPAAHGNHLTDSDDDFDSDSNAFSPGSPSFVPDAPRAIPPPPPLAAMGPAQQQSQCRRCCCGAAAAAAAAAASYGAAASKAAYVKSEHGRVRRHHAQRSRVHHVDVPAFQHEDFQDLHDDELFASTLPDMTKTPSAARSSASSAAAANEDFADLHAAPDSAVSASLMEKDTLYGSFDEHLFVDRYQRNNKCSGLKNLRCFPNCGPTHQPRKFCGQGITFHAVYKPDQHLVRPPASGAPPEFVAFGRFDTAIGRFNEVEIGSLVSLASIQAKERKRGRPLAPWYPSCQESAPSSDNSVLIDFKFNSKEHQGWHYDWVATKYTCDTLHVFNVYIFAIEGPDAVRCVGKFSSPAFQLYCRRRQRFRRMGTSTPNTSPATLLYHIASLLQKAQDPAAEDSDLESPGSPLSGTSSLTDAADEAKTDKKDAGSKQRRLQRILRRLAHHILGESAFTEHITTVCQDIAYRRDRGESIDVGYGRFLDAVRQYLHDFFKENGSTLTEIEELQSTAADIAKSNAEAAIKAEDGSVMEDKSMDQRKYGTAPLKDSKNPERRVRQVFLDLVDSCSTDAKRLKRPRRVEPHVLEGLEGLSKRLRIEVYSPSDAATVLGSPREPVLEAPARLPKADLDKYMKYDPSEPWIGLDLNSEPDLAGGWVPESYCALRLQQLRVGTMKMPWMRTQMLSSMEKESTFELTPVSFRIRLQRKLLSDGIIEYVFDGKEHPFDLKDPLMCVTTPMALTKQAFTIGNAVVIRHRYSETSRYTRIWWRHNAEIAHGRGILESRASIDSPWSIQDVLVANLVANNQPSPAQQDLNLPASPELLHI